MSVLPIWAHSRGIDYGRDNFYPPKDNPLPDAFTSATPKAGEFIWIWKPRESLPPGRYFSSVIWQGSLAVRYQISKGDAQIIGHGHPAGVDGRIVSDVSTLTTALKLITKIEEVYRP